MKSLGRLLALGVILCAAACAKDLLFVTTDWASSHEELLLIDPQTDRASTLWSTGHELDIGLSPDGSRLFVAHGPPGLAIVNPASGVTQQLRSGAALVRWIHPSRPSLAVSSDGRWVYLLNAKFQPGRPYDMALDSFDTQEGRFAGAEAPLPDCQAAQLWPLDNGLVGVRCAGTLRFFRLNDKGFAEQGGPVDLPKLTFAERGRNRDDFFVDGQLDPAGKALYFVSGAGRIVSVDLKTRQVTTGAKEPLLTHSHARQSSATITPDGRLWYVPVGTQQILAMDLQTSQPARVITPQVPFWGLTISSDGKALYAGAADHPWILVIDAATGQEIRKIALPGRPAILALAPAN